MSDMGFNPPPPPPPASGGEGASGSIPLAPMTPSQIVSSAFNKFGENWKQLIGISLAFVAVMFVIGLLLGLALAALIDSIAGATIAGLLLFGLFFVASMVMTGAVTRLVASDVAGIPTTVSESIRYGMTHMGSILVVGLLVFAILVVEMLVGILLAGALDAAALLILVFLGAAFLGLALSLSIPALVIENKRGSEALSRSWALIMSAFGHALGTFALAYLVVLAASIVISIIGSASDVLLQILNFILQVVVLPFFSLVLVLLYVNLRVKAGGVTKDTLQAELRATQ